MNDKAIFTVLGWEERFILSTTHILQTYDVSSVYLICFKDYLHMKNMKENLSAIKELLHSSSIDLTIIELEYGNSVSNWKALDNFFKSFKLQHVILNLTTFPRETIWTFLFFLRTTVPTVPYVYYKPESYDKSEGGLTKNHKNPRLLFKHSGVFDIDKKLALFIITGFDYSRTDLLIQHYEPAKVIYLSQKGKQFDNMIRNSGISPKTEFENIIIEKIEIDSYNIEESYKILDDLIAQNMDFNIVITSQGPKTSAISTYRAYLSNNDVALAYVPAREFSGEYSYGINSKSIVGEIIY